MKERKLEEGNNFQDFLSSLELNKLNEEEQIWLSSFGGEGSGGLTIVNPACRPANNCNGGNCVSGCSSTSK